MKAILQWQWSLLVAMLFSRPCHGVIINPEIIALDKNLTENFLVKGTTVTNRIVEGSEIVTLKFTWHYGIKDEPADRKAIPGILFKTIPLSSKAFDKIKIYETLERYSSQISCMAGIEYSSCQLMTVKEYLPQLLPIFSSLLHQPSLIERDIDLEKKKGAATIKGRLQKPSFAANELVNKLFYNSSHPFWIPYLERLEQFKEISSKVLKATYKKVKTSAASITVVGTIDSKLLKAMLAENFSWLAQNKSKSLPASPPQSQKKIGLLEHREIPTAYIKIKCQMPGIRSKESAAANLMMKILDEELGLEIRTRRSLSYSVYSYIINHSVGIGVIGASTSRPQETLKVVRQVMDKLRRVRMSDDAVARHKAVYATRYFLTLEEHSTLASALEKHLFHFGDPKHLYESTAEIDQLTGQDIQNVARKYLRNFRVGVVYDEEKFKPEWFSYLEN
ncbi:M16 family metallopeptidase [Pseudobacteriovorax antillogorgiicola]|uniref:Predicted Zn-dependent peptidase n=1 Tax=Pseudobacteriovorax antillogorgiicola TaxID=1513793 RepID=A0A1Y6C5S9_9BACT|nr:insulinase family protein [Pseudobacteriovorax antillogorgiicola]TCS49392.1 putative Zn-dependent peptidase [Pseudobacteriovorax antillogorgiicola]SMF47171.1 Predicted Zn-dependent peptidase [Pseudobacteriovorax antillogorgiicola]